MKEFFRLLLVIICITLSLTNCGASGNRGNKDQEDSVRMADSLAAVEKTRLEIEKAREDSIEKAALNRDSLKEKHIIVDKNSFTLYLREDGKTLMKVPVCLGKGMGQKKRPGDHKTPEGTFKIISIENSSQWTHDFHDGRGKVRGVHGPWFFRLNTPQSTHIGIHGTDTPESMGQRASDGCVRLKNEDLLQLKEHVSKGMTVIINPDKESDSK